MSRVSISALPALLFLVASVVNAQNPCCTPSQWQTNGLTVNNLGSVSHSIYYDKIGQQVRWDRVGNLEQRGVSQTIISWTQFNVGPVGQHPEYVYFVEQGKCFTYGADEWNDWCFGLPIEQQNFVGSTQVNGAACSVWQNKLQGFTWISRNSPCLPVSTMQSIANGSVQSTLFHNTTVGIKDMSVFDVPQVCQKQALKLSDMPQHLRRQLDMLHPLKPLSL